ncbi:MAG: NYN domain-containing protein [Candidatus Aminicenantales bacterium]
MAYLIDGNNFLGYTSPSTRNSLRTRQNLIAKLLKFQEIKNTRIILVFDGAPQLELISQKLRTRRFNLLFPHPGENADERIKEIISRESDLRRFYVVSSDRAIRSYTQSKGARSLRCEEFNRELRKALKVYRNKLDEKKNFPSPTRLETAHWLEVFKKKR